MPITRVQQFAPSSAHRLFKSRPPNPELRFTASGAERMPDGSRRRPEAHASESTDSHPKIIAQHLPEGFRSRSSAAPRFAKTRWTQNRKRRTWV